MRKVLSFSAFLIIGLLLSQYLPLLAGEGYATVKIVSNILLYICLSFIMINVGREFEVDKTRWRSYAGDYFIAMATAAMPWFLIAIYYVFVLLPPEFWNSWEAWKENLLLSRFAAPTSAGILFTMLAAIGLKSSWIYKKIQVLAIFDDLDTILLMIPLQIMMIGLRWQLIVVVFIVFVLLSLGWKQLGRYNWRQDWKAIMGYSVLVFVATQAVYYFSTRGRAAILKAYYLRNYPTELNKEVFTVSLNESSNVPYVLGRLFSVLETIQSVANPGINATIKDRYFNSACATPATAFPTLIKLAQKHLQKMSTPNEVHFSKQLTELMAQLPETGFPARLSLPEQGAFEIGYYHQTQKRYAKKNEEE